MVLLLFVGGLVMLEVFNIFNEFNGGEISEDLFFYFIVEVW